MLDQTMHLAEAAQQQSPYASLIMLVLMFAVFYFLLIRPQQKRAKEHKAVLDALQSGDNVITAGGIHGKIVGLQEGEVTLEIAPGVKIKVNRASVATKR